jgi:hypothetical protein
MNEKQAKELERSLKKFGLVEIPAIDQDNTLLAGHMRMATMIQLGRGDEEIDVRVPNRKLTEAEAKEYNLRSNKNTGEWDMDKLFAMPEGLLEEVGWDKKEIQKIIDGHTTVTEDDYNPDEGLKQPVRVHLGEIWQLGSHRLMCGDSTKRDDVERLMDGQKADMVFTDPPYGVDYTGGHFHSGDVNIKRSREKLHGDENEELYLPACEMITEFVDGPAYTFFAGGKPFGIFDAIRSVGGELHALLIWHKTNATYAAMNAQYKQRHEPFLYWKPKNAKTLRWKGESTEATIWEMRKDGKNNFHPTQKPVELAARAIQNHTVETVLDLFGGSGSTLHSLRANKSKMLYDGARPKVLHRDTRSLGKVNR